MTSKSLDGMSHASTATRKSLEVPPPVEDELLDPQVFEDNEKREVAEDPHLVHFTENDPENPKNWSAAKRWYLTTAGGLLVLSATFASSAPSGMVPQLMEAFDMSEELGSLTISVFIAGYCVGPLIWGPLSEEYGRRPIFILSFLVYTIFQIACAVATSSTQILLFRFIGGTFAAAPLTNSGALLGDIWDARTRGTAMALFTLSPFTGPALGPTVAGYIVLSGISWRWMFWVLSIFAGLCWLLILFTFPETYAPKLLVQKARRMRKETGDERWYAHTERLPKRSFAQAANQILARPFKILVREPMLLAVTIYMSFVYGCLYLLFEAYPIVFTEMHGFNAGVSGLMFLPLPLGGLFAVGVLIFYFNPRYEAEMARHAPSPVPPEFRLEIAIVAAPFFAVSFFWFAWTSSPSISFWAPMCAGLLLGCSIFWIFLALTNYIVDAYLFVAASALAANTVVRSLVGAAFPLFATQMYDALGAHWASSLIGFVALLLMPIPFVLTKYGPTLRLKSKYAPSKPIVSKETKDSPDTKV
ncbi:hypothetical protein HWV62_35362 [Athelia sp. TMB]|nr:hypothetical protein HWV62_35362 [Athelia sp. TMB]